VLSEVISYCKYLGQLSDHSLSVTCMKYANECHIKEYLVIMNIIIICDFNPDKYIF